MADVRISWKSAPALGDIRQLGAGDTIWKVHGVTRRADYGRYSDAIRHAINRGAEVRWIR